MNPLKKAYCRAFQNVFKFALPLLPYRNPKIIGSVKGIPEILEKRDYNKGVVRERTTNTTRKKVQRATLHDWQCYQRCKANDWRSA